MKTRHSGHKLAHLTLLATLAVGLSACGGGFDGIELNGKVFDALGVSGDLVGKKSEPKTQARAPLVIPPNTQRLPDPGSAGAAVAGTADIATGSIGGNGAWPVDREQQKVAGEAAEKKAKEARCRDGNWKEKAQKDERALASSNSGCEGSIFDTIGSTLFGKSEK